MNSLLNKPSALADRVDLGRPDGYDEKEDQNTRGSRPPPAFEPVKRFLTESDDDPILIDGELSLVPTAMALAAECQIRYLPANRSFHQYDGAKGIWRLITTEEAVKLCSDFIKRVAMERDAKHLLAKRRESLMKSTLALVKGCAVLGPPPDASKKLVAVKNGVLDLSGSTPVLLPHSPDYNFTSVIPHNYVPEAKCARFQNELLSKMLPAPADQSLFNRATGCMMVHGNAAQRVVLLMGEGGLGKSVIVSVLEGMLGWDRFAYLRTDRLSDRFETHGFQGKSILLGKDVGADYLSHKNAHHIKGLSGNDKGQSEQKYGGKVTLTGDFYVIITSNHLLRVVADEDARAWRRRLLPFHIKGEPPKKIISNFAQVLLDEEGEGILAWMIKGCMAHQAELAEHGDFVLTDEQKARIDEMIYKTQSTEHFVSKYIMVGKGVLTTEEIYNAYQHLCIQRRWIAVSEAKFEKDLSKLMAKLHDATSSHDIIKNGGQKRGYRGVRFTDTFAHPPSETPPIEVPCLTTSAPP